MEENKQIQEISKKENKKVVLSGVQPTGILTIGHLAGALINWKEMQDEYDTYFAVVDLHAITVRQVAADLRQRTIDTAAMFIACGIDPEKSVLFLQSHIPEHTQLTWVLSSFTGTGECSRMTQFKEKSQKNDDNQNVGLFTYPILMAADILLYQADLVPVGDDQKQHLELTRNLAQRFNHYYSDTFKVPDPLIPKVGARIMSLQDPTKKMSKSDENENSIIFLNDTDEVIIRKIKRSVTDSDNTIKYSSEKAGISNLMDLYHISTGMSIKDIESKFDGAGYGEFKSSVADAVAGYIAPLRDKFEKIRKDKDYLADVLTAGAEKARKTASRTLSKVYKKVGFVSFK